jgi:hypothetical protein
MYYVSDALEMEEDKMEIAVALPVISLRSFSPRRPRAAWFWTRLAPRVHAHHTLTPHTETPDGERVFESRVLPNRFAIDWRSD